MHFHCLYTRTSYTYVHYKVKMTCRWHLSSSLTRILKGSSLMLCYWDVQRFIFFRDAVHRFSTIINFSWSFTVRDYVYVYKIHNKFSPFFFRNLLRIFRFSYKFYEFIWWMYLYTATFQVKMNDDYAKNFFITNNNVFCLDKGKY